jgi:hypothetical protein
MADKKLNVKRSALSRHAITDISFRPPPRMPASMIKRFPELADYNTAWERWVNETQLLMRSLASIKVE